MSTYICRAVVYISDTSLNDFIMVFGVHCTILIPVTFLVIRPDLFMLAQSHCNGHDRRNGVALYKSITITV